MIPRLLDQDKQLSFRYLSIVFHLNCVYTLSDLLDNVGISSPALVLFHDETRTVTGSKARGSASLSL